jgi:predicted GH43/DUF377 family glycosyl hydrolase
MHRREGLMETATLRVVRRSDELAPDDKRVITRPFSAGNLRRVKTVIDRVLRLPEERVQKLLIDVMIRFSVRHRDLKAELMERFEEVERCLEPCALLSEERKLLIGSYFMMEYSIESAALFNPSIVPHPDQSRTPGGSVRFLMSLRATGEGHVSSIVFRQGFISATGEIRMVPTAPFAYSPEPVPDRVFERSWFVSKLRDMGVHDDLIERVASRLEARFTRDTLYGVVEAVRTTPGTPRVFETAAAQMLWLAESSYEVRFRPDCAASECVIFPATENEHKGMEDLRLVRFTDDDGTVHYYGTYTAYDGAQIYPMLLDTCGFRTFRVTPLGGRYACDKGMALFPRRHNGRYLSISRHDGESLFLLSSDDIRFWNEARPLYEATEPWEFTQIGNCGSPVETEAGWILLTHGVGAVRQYCIGVLLLDRDDPSKIIGRLREPLLIPDEAEREGYVPNVVYSCGSMIHNGQLIIPYAMSDSRTTFAEVPIADLVEMLIESGP